MKKAIIISISTFLIALIVMIPISAISYAYFVDRIEEKYDAWCWVACAEMLVKSKLTSNRDQVGAVKYVVENCNSYSGNEKKSFGSDYQLYGGTLLDTYYAVKYISNNKIIPIRGNALTRTGLINKLSAQYPVIAILSVSNQNYGHAIIIYYYNDSDDRVKIVEPDKGETNTRPYLNYAELISGDCAYRGTNIKWEQYISISSISS